MAGKRERLTHAASPRPMIRYRVHFVTSKGYRHCDVFRTWHEAREAYALALRTYGADAVQFVHVYPEA